VRAMIEGDAITQPALRPSGESLARITSASSSWWLRTRGPLRGVVATSHVSPRHADRLYSRAACMSNIRQPTGSPLKREA